MDIDLFRLAEKLADAPSEPSVPTGETLPYLLEHVWRPLAEGKDLQYRDIDFDQFEADDLRILSDYNDRVGRVSYELTKRVLCVIKAPAAVRWTGTFC